MRIKGLEQETIINWNMEEDTASLFTYSKRIQRHMEVILGLKPIRENSSGGKDYEFPKKWCKLPRKTKTRNFTPEQKEAMKTRFAKARKLRAKK